MRKQGTSMLLNVRIPMRDRVNLSADIYLPNEGGPFPVLLMRTPYDNTPMIGRGQALAEAGYVLVAQDCRGRYDSDGEFYPWHNEAADGVDTIKWIAKQKWCDGNVGMVGGSYVGLVQWLAAVQGPRHLKCIVPRVITSNFYDSPNYAGGAFQLALNMTWGFSMVGRSRQAVEAYDWPKLFRTLPLIDADELVGHKLKFWKDWVRHPSYGPYWEEVSIEERYEQITIPALIMGGWYDLYAKQAFTNFVGMRERAGTEEARRYSRLIVGPWPHGLAQSTMTGDVDFGPESIVDLERMEMQFLDHWLRGRKGPRKDTAPLRIFVMGANRWRSEHEWPLARTQWTPYYLRSQGHANGLDGDGLLSPEAPADERPDKFTYNPNKPVPTLGGNNCCRAEIVPQGAMDQRPAEQRADVLVYTTPPLTRDVEVTGPIVVKLYASSSALDTDFTAKLVDVSPDGYAMNLCDGIIRARYRDSFRRAKLLKPGQVYEFTVDCWVTSNRFKKGHRIRLDIASSNFPRFDRNPNTGHRFGMDAELRKAKQTIHHSAQHPSHVLLPVIPTR